MKREYISKSLREKVRNKFNGLCSYCGVELKRMHIDHLVPYASTQDNSLENLMPSCQACNLYKSTLSIKQFRREIETSVAKARRYSVNFRFAEKYGLVIPNEMPIVFFFERSN